MIKDLKKNILPFHIDQNSGFTIIEVMIVISIMVLIFVVGIANFRDTQQRQELQAAVLSIKTDLRFTQEQALAGRKPSGCNFLNGYVFISAGTNKYRTEADCDTGTRIIVGASEIDITERFPTVSITSISGEIFFNVLGRGVRNAPVTINVSNSTGVRTITVTTGGEIN